jgi:hypothetical protein
MRARGGEGAVLVVVLLISLSIWLLLAGVLLVTRLQLEMAVAARDHALARAVAGQLLEQSRAATRWPADPALAEAAGETGGCRWSVVLLEQDDRTARYEAEVVLGRAQVRVDATVHRPVAAALDAEP